jgi:hypothetical protein
VREVYNDTYAWDPEHRVFLGTDGERARWFLRGCAIEDDPTKFGLAVAEASSHIPVDADYPVHGVKEANRVTEEFKPDVIRGVEMYLRTTATGITPLRAVLANFGVTMTDEQAAKIATTFQHIEGNISMQESLGSLGSLIGELLSDGQRRDRNPLDAFAEELLGGFPGSVRRRQG